MSRIPTTIILNKNGPVVINVSDYDPAIHTLAPGAEAVPAPENELELPLPLPAAVTAPVAPPKPVAATQAPAPKKPAISLAVMPAGNLFVVVDGATLQPVFMDGINPGGYKSADEALAAIKALA